ncbi:MAG TPA: SMP-30/gluconolactonase/LRE family protein, partial [Xanthobacteraceae bacterium]|nr:SMP-30/gluconolactonase/LRE family protein [Xanthobacteraceae bacterium]
NLFIAEYGAGRVLVVDGKGALIATIAIPERYVTAPAFGPDEARVFVTAPSNNTTPPFVGKVYSIANPVFRKD